MRLFILLLPILVVLPQSLGAQDTQKPVEGPILDRLIKRRFDQLEAKQAESIKLLEKRFDTLGLKDFFDRSDKQSEALSRKLDGLKLGDLVSQIRDSTSVNREFQQELKSVGGARGLIGEFQRGRAEIFQAKAEMAKANAQLQKTASSLGPLARLGQNFFYLCLFLGGGLLFLLLVLMFSLLLIRRQINRFTGVVEKVV